MNSKRNQRPPLAIANVVDVPLVAREIRNITSDKKLSSNAIVEVPISPSKRKANNIVRGVADEHIFAIPPNATAIREYLTRAGWPEGLQQALVKSCQKYPIRFFITDDSGSMLTNDGHRLVGSHDKTKVINCTRWSELTESMIFHAKLSEIGNAPSEFRLLNNADPIMVGCGDDGGQGLQLLLSVLDENPGGQTPLCRHLAEVVKQIQDIEHQLRSAGQKACVVIATDGESTDGDIAEAMKPLQDLPVW
jgi:hypothetical protein